MMLQMMFRTLALACTLFAAAVIYDGVCGSGIMLKEAQAIIGRPATPLSAAGVARRTTRRTIRRTTMYVAALPRGCTTVVIEGATLHQCGRTYYQPYGKQFVVVNVN